ncbi:MAG: hypothetical protein ACRC62_00060, partial [Microcoleus sp.]
LQVAIQAIDRIKQLEELPDDWHELAPILSSRKEEPNIRLYLNAYHSVAAIVDEPTVTFSIYGETHHSKRFEFDPATRTAKIF